MKRALGAVTPWDAFEKSMRAAEHPNGVNGTALSAPSSTAPSPEPTLDHATQVASAKKDLAGELDVGQTAAAHGAACSKGGECVGDGKCCRSGTGLAVKSQQLQQHLPHSREDDKGHQAQHGTAAERKEHHAPAVQPAH